MKYLAHFDSQSVRRCTQHAAQTTSPLCIEFHVIELLSYA